MLFGCTVAFLLHVFFLVQFSYFAVYPLAYFNVMSVSIFGYCIWRLIKTDETSVVITIASLEVITHQLLAGILLGWELGYQFFLLTMPVFIHLGRFKNPWVPRGLTTLSVLSLVWLIWRKLAEVPAPYHMPGWITSIIFTINLLSAMFLLAEFAAIFSLNAKLHEQALLAANVEARAASEAKSRFLAVVSHEIRTPMNAIMGFTDLALEKSVSAPGIHRDLRRIRSASGTLLSLINEILDFSKIEADKLEIVSQPVDLRFFVQEVQEMFEPEVGETDMSFSLQWELGELEHPVAVDPVRLKQILINLLGNAIKFTERGGVKLAVRKSASQDSVMEFEVEDTGPGMSEELLSRLFEPFQQADSGVQRRHGGTGLGLSISRRLARLMGGDLGVDSELGKGSRFLLTLPFCQLKKIPLEALEVRSGRLPGPGEVKGLTGLRALVVDDVELNRELTQELLSREGVVTTLAISGEEALNALRDEPFDAVLMDIGMPGMSGYEATKRIREMGLNELPVIAMTAHAREEDRQRSHEAGMNDHVIKPLDIQQLISALTRCVPGIEVKSQAVERPAEGRGDPVLEEVVDTQDVLRRLHGDEEALHRLLRYFRARYSEIGQDLDGLMRSGSREAWNELAHEVKGAAANISASAIRDAAERLERASDGDSVAQAVAELTAEMKKFFRHTAFLATPPSGQEKVSSKVEEVVLESLLESLENNDLEALTMLDRLGEQPDLNLVGATLDELKEHVANLRFDEALKLIREKQS